MISQEFTVLKVEDKKQWEMAYSVRLKVFVQEQNVPMENELDELDKECIHWIINTSDGNTVGTVRLYVQGSKGKLGRMAVLKEFRKKGLGRLLIAALEDYASKNGICRIKCHAQEYIKDFYIACGYSLESDEIFLEEDIRHVYMYKDIKVD